MRSAGKGPWGEEAPHDLALPRIVSRCHADLPVESADFACGRSATDEAAAGCAGGGAGVDAEFGIDAREVGFYGSLSEMESVADGQVGQSLGNQAEDFGFAAGQGGAGARSRFMSRSAIEGARVVRPAAAVRTALAKSSGGASSRR